MCVCVCGGAARSWRGSGKSKGNAAVPDMCYGESSGAKDGKGESGPDTGTPREWEGENEVSTTKKSVGSS